MKPVKLVLVAMLCIIFQKQIFPQGASCSNPHVMALDTVSRSYTISPTSGNAAHCNTSDFNGNGKITVFSFTTDGAGSCVLVHLSSSPAQPVELSLYTGCGSNGSCSGLQSTSSVCFSDGEGLWAPFEQLTLNPNTTYYLRAWTPDPGSLTMSARNYPPPNALCSGATVISPLPTTDQNACNKASTEVTPIQLCAFSLENTAFYTYFVESDGVSSIQLNNVSCDNSDLGANNGFQIGFFIGSCGALTKIGCATASGGSLSTSTGWLASGTQVFVAIDGTSGSNCSYTITAFNATILPIKLKYFTAWKRAESNQLTWETTSEDNFSHFEIEKSIDGVNYISIGTQHGKGTAGKITNYSFDDYELKSLQYYRLKYVDIGGKFTYSNVIKVSRTDLTNAKVIFSNKVSTVLSMKLIDMPSDKISIEIIDNAGRRLKKQIVQVSSGENSVSINTSSIQTGFYYIVLYAENYKRTFSFVKS